jgi:hypothetical protein
MVEHQSLMAMASYKELLYLLCQVFFNRKNPKQKIIMNYE